MILPASIDNPINLSRWACRKSPMQADRMAAPHPPPFSSAKGILFQFDASSSMMLKAFIQVFPGALPPIHLEQALYSFPIFKAIQLIESVVLESVSALAVAICMTVSSLYFQSKPILSANGPLPFVNVIISLWISLELVLNYQEPFL